MKPYYLLNFGDIDIVNPNYEFQPPRPQVVKGQMLYNNQVDADATDIFTSEFCELLIKMRLTPVRRVIVFSYSNRRPAFILPHCDGHEAFNPALNLTVGQSRHCVEWYKPKWDGAGTLRQTPFGEPVRTFSPKELDIIQTTTHKGPMLFNTAIPHLGRMIEGTEEWTISVRFHVEQHQEAEFLDKFTPFFHHNT